MDFQKELLRAKELANIEPDTTAKICSKIIDHDPDSVDAQMALFMFAYVMLESGKPGIAYHMYERCAAMNPNVSEIYSNMGMCFEYSDNTRARKLFKKAIKKSNKNANAYANLGLMDLFEGNPRGCIYNSEKALELAPNLRAATHNIGLAKLMLKDWSGWEQYFHTLGVKHREARDYGVPDWNGEKDCTVLVYGEQGVGDEIMFASCLPDVLKDVKVVFDCDARLEALFRRSFPGVPTYGDRFKTESRAADQEFDYQCAIGQLPYFYRKSDESFPGTPYLKPNKQLDYGLGPRKKIGLAWNGGLSNTKQKERSIALEDFKDIFDKRNTYVNLDYKDPSNDSYKLQTFESVTGKGKSIDDLAALVSQLDYVVTCCTTVVYIAGALGIPCLVLVPTNPGYRYYSEGQEFHWHSSVTLFRQQPNQSWKDTIDAAQKAHPEYF
jgi:tetratricopeptide (TPR) repeat protein